MKATASAWKRFLLCFTCGLVWLGSGPPASAAETTASEPTTTGGGLTVLDWIVLGAYAVGMLLIGYYYSRRTRSADDYLLGGRVMKPWMVGLSMFATFLSVLTYLALPGEMIAHGPMMLAQVLGFPVVALVVCWLIIPYIMRFRVTSGYEILEARFGESVRLLGATMFLLVRFLWMGLVIYATVDKVFVPVLGLDQAWVPAVCAVVGLITVIYSSMGGLRAVVLSDAIQAIILCSGAVLAVVLITVSLGSVSDWWPTEWQTHWDPRRYWFSPTSRMDVASVVTGVVLWWVATAGSDQMAIQRYLSTRDVRSARRMFSFSIAANIFLACILGVLGFALLGYFQHHPEMLAADQTISGNADQLLPRYIVVGMPAGISGLVIAALAAATMSSLSSGVNSASSVITTDLIGRFRKITFTEEDRLRTARRVSWIVGVAAILLSLAAGGVEGNLLVKCYKIANVFTVPLFMLFFMAMFVPWATTLGTWAAALASAVVAIAIGFNQPISAFVSQLAADSEMVAVALTCLRWLDLSFLWVVIGSMITGVIVGPSVSAAERLAVLVYRAVRAVLGWIMGRNRPR